MLAVLRLALPLLSNNLLLALLGETVLLLRLGLSAGLGLVARRPGILALLLRRLSVWLCLRLRPGGLRLRPILRPGLGLSTLLLRALALRLLGLGVWLGLRPGGLRLRPFFRPGLGLGALLLRTLALWLRLRVWLRISLLSLRVTLCFRLARFVFRWLLPCIRGKSGRKKQTQNRRTIHSGQLHDKHLYDSPYDA
ncbi:MAG: hypothetical protein ABI383_12315 [Acidobacteriaceae bacterium]